MIVDKADAVWVLESHNPNIYKNKRDKKM